MNTNNIILRTDSYKASHWLQYPPGTQYVFSYVESRGGEYDNTVFFGLQVWLKEVLSKPITLEMIDEAEEILTLQGEPFNREGWLYILNKHNGYLPLRIRAVPEGLVIPTHNVLATIENTDSKCFWLTSYVETMMLRAIWYPTTVATISYHVKQLIKEYMEKTADNLYGLPFKLHDFGARGVSSGESAALGGLAHLVNFQGTDTVEAVVAARKYYNETMAGFSIPAAEHSTMTSWGGEDGEILAMENMLEQFAKPGRLVAVVSDSFNIYRAVKEYWGGYLRQKVLDSGATLVVRPDSGNPPEVVLEVVKLLNDAFGSTINSKGFKVLNPAVRVIQGDGVNPASIEQILNTLYINGYSADNVAYGMGGALLQKLNRDTLKFALKASAIEVDDEWFDVYKEPITDPGKNSKKGRLTLYRNKETLEYFSGREAHGAERENEVVLQTVFVNGKVTKEYTLKEVRANTYL